MLAPTPIPPPTGLQVEFYQLVQAAVYHADGLWGDATFDLYVKQLPENYGYMIAAGIEPTIDAILNMRFTEAEISWLKRHPTFSRISPRFFESLRMFRFQGDIHAVDEGTPVFPDEPILRVTGPLTHVGLLETLLVQGIAVPSAVATRAARMSGASGGRPIIDFGARRCAGQAAAWQASRAAWIGGCTATTNAAVSGSLGIPAWSVMSDSLLAAYANEPSAYEAFCHHFPGRCHINIQADAVEPSIKRLSQLDPHLRTVRIDHPDLDAASRQLRNTLDQHEMTQTRILGSGSLDEWKIQAIAQAASPIDMFGVGAALTVGNSEQVPSISFRIAEIYRGPEPSPVNHHWCSPWPGQKQVVRFPDHDLVCLDVEAAHFVDQGQSLLKRVVLDGRRVTPITDLDKLREGCQQKIEALPRQVRALDEPTRFPVQVTDSVRNLKERD